MSRSDFVTPARCDARTQGFAFLTASSILSRKDFFCYGTWLRGDERGWCPRHYPERERRAAGSPSGRTYDVAHGRPSYRRDLPEAVLEPPGITVAVRGRPAPLPPAITRAWPTRPHVIEITAVDSRSGVPDVRRSALEIFLLFDLPSQELACWRKCRASVLTRVGSLHQRAVRNSVGVLKSTGREECEIWLAHVQCWCLLRAEGRGRR